MKTRLHLLFIGMSLAMVGTCLSQPVITDHPQSTNVCSGTLVALEVKATGAEPLTYQWRGDFGTGSSDLYRQTNSTLSLAGIQASGSADYYVVVGDALGGTKNSDVAHVVFLTPVSIPSLNQPTNWPIVSLGATVANRVAGVGSQPISCQWRFNGEAIPGQTRTTITLSNMQLSDRGIYDVVLANMCGSVTSRVVTLNVDPTFTKITTGPLATDRGNTESASWGDFDADGHVDLFVARWDMGLTKLYHNNGDGTFVALDRLPSQTVVGNWQAGAWADFDNDGRLDLFAVPLEGTSYFYFNNGDGTFTQSQFQSVKAYGIALTDYNRDGLLDVTTSSWAGGYPALFRNNGNRTFTRITSPNVWPGVNTTSWGGVAWADYDDNGFDEVYLARFDQSKNLFLHNDGNGRFVPVTNLVTQTSQAAVTGAWGDYDNDGRLDLLVACYYGNSTVYRNIGNGQFERANVGATLGKGYSGTWVDYDNDGFLDIFLTYTNALYHNNGNGTFSLAPAGNVGREQPEGTYGASYTSSWFDYDNDGFLDLYVANGNEGGGLANIPNFFYHNNGNTNAWLAIKPLGTTSNRSGIGATVRVRATYAGQIRWQRREITSGGGDVSTGQQLYAYFGLGEATNVDLVRIKWPSGVVEEFTNIAPRQYLTLVEPSLRGRGDGKFRLAMTASTNRVYSLEASSDLVNWTSLTNFTGSSSYTPIEFVDPEAPAANTKRFYRMR